MMFDSCFKFETLIRFDFGQRMTHRDRRIFRLGISAKNPFNERIFNEIATMIARNVQGSVLVNLDISNAYAKIITVSKNQMVITSKLFSSPQILHHAPYSTQDSGDSSVCRGHQIL